MKRLITSLLLLMAVVGVAQAQATTCLGGAAGATPSATLTFTAPTLNTDGTAIATPLTYNLYQGTVAGQETKVASAVKGSPISLTTGLNPGTAYYWKISVVDAHGVESALSNEVCKTFPESTPGAVVITIS